MDDFSEILRAAKLSTEAAAQLLGVHPNTIRRWLKHGAPVIALRALEFRAGCNDEWYGWKFEGPRLVNYAGQSFHRNTLASFDDLRKIERRLGYTEGYQHGQRHAPPQLPLF